MKNKLIAGFLLLALAAWAFPLTVSGQTAVTIHEPHEVQEIKSVNEYHQTEPKISRKSVQTTPRVQPLRKMAEPTPESSNSGRDYSGKEYTKEEVQQLIRSYSALYGIESDAPLCIARFESGYNQFSKNSNSTASGVFQYLNGTWAGTDEGRAGLSVFDAEANIKAAIKYMSSRRNAIPWTTAKNCPKLSTLN